jgi:hypothetical protein
MLEKENDGLAGGLPAKKRPPGGEAAPSNTITIKPYPMQQMYSNLIINQKLVIHIFGTFANA